MLIDRFSVAVSFANFSNQLPNLTDQVLVTKVSRFRSLATIGRLAAIPAAILVVVMIFAGP